MSESADILSRNLSSLAVRDRARAERLCLPVTSDHVLAGPDGRPHIRHGMRLVPLAVDDLWVQERAAEVPPHSEPVIFGLGLGELALRLLQRKDLPSITVYERDPWLVRLFLQRVDCGRSLVSGRLRLRFVSDLIEELPRWKKRPVIPHPLLVERYAAEWALVQHGVGEQRALVVTGELLVPEVSDALRALGYSVFPWDVAAHAREELALVVEKVRPRFAVAINMVNGLAAACQTFKLPLLIWEIDPRLDAVEKVQGVDTTWVFSWREARLSTLRDAGYSRVAYLALAASPARAETAPTLHAAEERPPVAFVGSSMVENAERCREEFLKLYVFWAGGLPDAAREEGELLLLEALAEQRESIDEYVLPRALDERFGPFLRAMRARKDVSDPGMLAAELAAADRRHFLVSNLGQVGIHVWGDDGWKLCAEHGVRVRGPAGHGAELTAIYREAGITVDIGRIYQRDIVTLRVFEAMAAGAFVLAEDSAALRAIFTPGVHLDTWATVQELLDKVEAWLEKPEERAAIAKAGQAEVLARHRIEHRVSEMLERAGFSP